MQNEKCLTLINACIDFIRLNFKYEIIGIPTVILFHNGNFIAKHQITDNTFFGFTKFLIFYTGMYDY